MAKKPQPPAPKPNTPPAAAAAGAIDVAGAPGAPENTDAPADTGKPASPNGLRITAAREGFRRAGWRWSSQPTTVPLTEFTAEEEAMIRAETMLTVEDVVIEASAE